MDAGLFAGKLRESCGNAGQCGAAGLPYYYVVGETPAHAFPQTRKPASAGVTGVTCDAL